MTCLLLVSACGYVCVCVCVMLLMYSCLGLFKPLAYTRQERKNIRMCPGPFFLLLLLILHEVNSTQKAEHLHHIVTLWCGKFFFDCLLFYSGWWIAFPWPSHNESFPCKIHICSFHLTYIEISFSPSFPSLLPQLTGIQVFPAIHSYTRSIFHLSFWWIIRSHHDTQIGSHLCYVWVGWKRTQVREGKRERERAGVKKKNVDGLSSKFSEKEVSVFVSEQYEY